MKLHNYEIFSLFAALNALDPYKFPNDEKGKTRWDIARNISKLKKEVKILQKTRLGMIRDGKLDVRLDPKGNEIIDTTTPEGQKFAERWDGLMEEEVECNIRTLDFTKLDVDPNKIPPTVIADLLPVLTNAPDDGKSD